MQGSPQFSKPPVAFNIAGPQKRGLQGPAGPAGAPFTQSVTSVAVANGGTVTLSPAVGQDVLITPPGTGGSFTINVGTVAARQRVLVDIINGATACTVTLTGGNVAGSILSGSTSPTYSGGVANTTDNLTFIAPGSTAAVHQLRLEALNLGFAA